SWSDNMAQMAARGQEIVFDETAVVTATYRPFMKAWLYLSPELIDRPYQTRYLMAPNRPNQAIYFSAPGGSAGFSCFFLDTLPDRTLPGAGNPGQMFARWQYEQLEVEGGLPFDTSDPDVVDGWRRTDNITDYALDHFTVAYGTDFTKDDIFFYIY